MKKKENCYKYCLMPIGIETLVMVALVFIKKLENGFDFYIFINTRLGTQF